MSSAASTDPTKEPGASSKSKKKNKKKKAAGGASKPEETGNTNGSSVEHVPEADDAEVQETDEVRAAPVDHSEDVDDVEDEPQRTLSPSLNGTTPTQHSIHTSIALGLTRNLSQGGPLSPSPPPPADTTAQLEELLVEQKSLEAKVKDLEEQVEQANANTDFYKTKYETLAGKISSIRSTFQERLNNDAAKYDEAQDRIAELEEANEGHQTTISELRKENDEQAAEITSLRNRLNMSQQNWIQERDDLIAREAHAREEFENMKEALQEWEVLAMNERSIRQSMEEQVGDLKEQVEVQGAALDKVTSERDLNSQTVEGLQRALQEVQNARKTERRELVEQAQSQLQELRNQLQAAVEAASTSKAELEKTRQELERALPFEKEIKEKNLIIGKLRHEAVTLNEHLTKALRLLKKGKPEENVDRQIVSNYFLHFLALDRADPKKFEALQLIAQLLGWNDEQKEQAGLARPGASSNNSLRIPLGPFRRTPSTPSLQSPDPMLMANLSSGGGSRESLGDLFSEFLERASEASQSRRGSKGSEPVGLGVSEK